MWNKNNGKQKQNTGSHNDQVENTKYQWQGDCFNIPVIQHISTGHLVDMRPYSEIRCRNDNSKVLLTVSLIAVKLADGNVYNTELMRTFRAEKLKEDLKHKELVGF